MKYTHNNYTSDKSADDVALKIFDCFVVFVFF